ncbi:MAG: NAD-dependent epimerase/dehydratase family protein [Atopobiaceae bacterium]|nr:NAD-dependent epimerase/dehydratase family protein [Atopobiaceae bacterium]
MMQDVLREDAKLIASDETMPWSVFDGKTVVVTGATGLIGKSLVATLLARANVADSPLHVVALVRNEQKLRAFFGNHPQLSIVCWDAMDPLIGEDAVPDADYVFHCANMTSSSDFINRPVEVIETTVGGARAALELARRTGAKLCLLSTMETYGEVAADHAITEAEGGFLDAMVVRNSYPEAKRLDEALCAAYASELGVDVSVVRLVQTFGPGVDYHDGRVFADFARCACEGRDIVLLTDGSKQNSYLYTADAVTALLFAAAYGESGVAYNAANDDAFCSIREMAGMVAERFGKGKVDVRIEIDSQAAKRFRKGSLLRLDTSRLRALGWVPKVGLPTMYERMMASWN